MLCIAAADIDNMKRLAIIKFLRTKKVDYSGARDLDELRLLAKQTIGVGGNFPIKCLHLFFLGGTMRTVGFCSLYKKYSTVIMVCTLWPCCIVAT